MCLDHQRVLHPFLLYSRRVCLKAVPTDPRRRPGILPEKPPERLDRHFFPLWENGITVRLLLRIILISGYHGRALIGILVLRLLDLSGSKSDEVGQEESLAVAAGAVSAAAAVNLGPSFISAETEAAVFIVDFVLLV